MNAPNLFSRRCAAFGVIFFCATFTGCVASTPSISGTIPGRAAKPALGTAEGAYAQGVEYLARNQVTEAQKAFSDLKVAHPYSKFAALSDLRLADSYMRRSQWLEAVDAYRTFLRFHPSHPEGSYASFQIGEAQMAQMPRDWFFMAPSAEKDQDAIRSAISAFEELLTRSPDGPMADKARCRLKECGRRLAHHEMYVARFYAKKAHPEGAWGRAESVLAQYPGVGYDAEALLIAGRARLARGYTEAGEAHLRQLLDGYPASREALTARTLLSPGPPQKKRPKP